MEKFANSTRTKYAPFVRKFTLSANKQPSPSLLNLLNSSRMVFSQALLLPVWVLQPAQINFLNLFPLQGQTLYPPSPATVNGIASSTENVNVTAIETATE